MSAKIYPFPTRPERVSPTSRRVGSFRLIVGPYRLEDGTRFAVCLLAIVLFACALDVAAAAFIAHLLGAGQIARLGLLTAGVVLAACAVLLLIEYPEATLDAPDESFEEAS